MNVRKTFGLLSMAAACFTAAVEPSSARTPVSEAIGSSQFYEYVAPNIRFSTGSAYQEPDGTYESLSDFTRDINGTPCGIECSARAQERWSHPHAR